MIRLSFLIFGFVSAAGIASAQSLMVPSNEICLAGLGRVDGFGRALAAWIPKSVWR